jgi:hypothetical protein
MNHTVKRSLSVLLLVTAIAAAMAAPVLSETINMRSGGGYAYGQNDPAWTYLIGPAGAALSAAPFTAADFTAALSGPQSVVVPPYGSFWLASLLCDSQAQWISVDAAAGPATALYGQTFGVQTCCIAQAILKFCWASDDNIGDQLYGGANPMGVYLNGVALPITGGSYATEDGASIDVTGIIHCGQNEIHVYNRDAAFVVTGVMFSVNIDILSCPVSTEQSTWGSIKALYR